MTCTVCSKFEGTVSGIVKGEYISDVCRQCYDRLLLDQSVSAGHAEYNRQRDYEDHQTDIAQPYTKDGHFSRDFARLYPKQARKLMSEDEFRKLM